MAKEKVSIEASSPHSTFAAASQVNVVNDDYFLVEFPQNGLASTLGCLPDRSHRYCLHAVWLCLNSTKVDSGNPAKDKRKIRESKFFIREEWLFADKGIYINHQYI